MWKQSPIVSAGTARIRATFNRLRRQRRKALIPFLMGGDGGLRATADLIRTLADAGADLIEVGIPFSDPVADGPIIQRATMRALARGTTPPALLEMLSRVARQVPVPLVLLSYWNPIARYGHAHGPANDPTPFVRAATQAGVAGVIVPDLPPEEAEPLCRIAARHGVATVFLASPTSPPSRLRQIARRSEGFIYYVSVTGTTGVRKGLPTEWLQGVRQLRLMTTKPICVGFGISTPGQAQAIGRLTDGVIIGSALLQRLEPFLGRPSQRRHQAQRFLLGFRRALSRSARKDAVGG